MMMTTTASQSLITFDEAGFPDMVDRESLALLQHIKPAVYVWSGWQAERQLYFNGYVARTPQGKVLIDPPCCDEYLLVAFEAFGVVDAIILTNADHERASAEIAETLGLPVWIHEADAHLLKRPPNRTFKTGELLLDCLQVLSVPNQKTAGECALWWEAETTLFVGDAFIAAQQDKLTLLAAEKYADIPQAKTSLLETFLPFQPSVSAILLGDGEPVLRNAPAVLGQFLSSLLT
jgi:glyoxylase-like metal-dependent hydrolase (beta-lactamase superfamily II)